MRKEKSKVTKQDIMVAAYEALIARHEGRVSPRILLDEARDPSSPFHDAFEWDDELAGEQYRLAQVQQLIRRWKGSVMRIDAETKVLKIETTRRLQSPRGQRKKGSASYLLTEAIMADPALREDMISTVLRELSAYRRRYAEIVALADVWRAIDDALELHAVNQPRGAVEAPRPPA